MMEIRPEQCTKEELVWWIRQHELHYPMWSFSAEIFWKRSEKLLDEMDVIVSEQQALLNQYNELLEPYNGTKISDIPHEIGCRAVDMEEKIILLTKQYEKKSLKLQRLSR